MRKIAIAAIALLAVVAWAGENRYLGRIVSPGTPVTNVSTLFPFPIPAGSKLTVYCNAAANILTDSRTVTAVYDGGSVVCDSPTGFCSQPYGLPYPAATLVPTSVGRALTVLTDGGVGEPTALIAMQPSNPLDAGACDVWQRSGLE